MKFSIQKLFYTTLFIASTLMVDAQQNHALYFMHNLPQSNLLNPAVPISCKWYVGIPVLSSTHVNYGNSSFTYNQLFNAVGDGTYQANIDNVVKRLHWRNYLGTEVHTQLFGLGYRTGDYSFMFTITEKNNLPITYPKKAIMFLWGGNTQFEGETANFNGTGINFNHYREYAISASKQSSSGLYFGARAKLLFGKLNVSTKSMNVGLNTDATTFNLHFSGDIEARTSLPIVVTEGDNLIENIEYDESTSPMSLALNRKNPGFAADFGVIYPYSDKIELSASVVDLGFIRWRSNLNNFKGSGDFFYSGPLGDSINTQNYVDELINAFTDSMNVTITPDKYTTFLPPRILAGGTYQINNMFTAGLQAEAIVHRSKVITSATISAQAEPINNFHVVASYSLQYYDLKSVGLGFVIGKNPVQFYIMSDNVIGTIWPMSSRNINLRFGLNINLGCHIKEKSSGSGGRGQLEGNCYWLEKSLAKRYKRTKQFKKKKKHKR